MKTLITLILLAAAFLGGYHLGHQPNSPDVIAWAQQTYKQATAAGQQLVAVANKEPSNVAEKVAPQDMRIEVGGKTYIVSGQPQAKEAPARR